MSTARVSENKWLVFTVTGIASLVVSFSMNSMTLALPLLVKEFSVGQSVVSWLAITYSLIPCCTLLIFGRTGDLFGYKKQFKIGFIFYAAVCLVAPLLSSSIGILILFRSLQGLGYSILISITQAIVSRSFPENERGMALGVHSVFVSVGFAIGPSLGGLLLTHFSWHALFYFNVPFCLAGYLTSCRYLPDDNPAEKGGKQMDVLGAVLLSISLGAIVIGLNLGGGWGYSSLAFISCIVVGLGGIWSFIRHEIAAPSPLMNLHLFRNRTFTFANIVCMISYLVQQLINYLMPFYLISILLLGADRAGLIMLASPLLMILCSPVGGRLTDKKGSRFPAGLGLILICAGCLIMVQLGETTAYYIAIIILILMGAGNGFSVTSINTAIIDATPREHTGIASGMLATMRTLGQACGVLFATIILSLRQPVYSLFTEQQAYLFAQRDTFYFGMFLVVLAIILVWRLPQRKQKDY